MSQRTEMPAGYVLCTATTDSCPLCGNCLRSRILRDTDYASQQGNSYLPVVNIWNDAINPLTNRCLMYRTDTKQRFARGFKHLFDNVPKGIYATVAEQVKAVFPNERYFYYCKKGTHLTSPQEQANIAQIFKDNQIAEPPVFDEYVEVYDWS